MFDSGVQLEIFPTTLDLRRIDLALNMRRYYRLSVQRDLFGRACLIREWGRIGARGQSLIEFALNNTHVIDFAMKQGGFSGYGLQGFV